MLPHYNVCFVKFKQIALKRYQQEANNDDALTF